MNTNLFAVTRSFQGGASFATFNKEKCDKGLVAPIKKLFDTAPPELKGLVVVTCAELGSKYAEELREGETPTTSRLQEFFPEEIASGKLVPVVSHSWGLNAGSATAINAGIVVANERNADKLLVWSPEIDLSGHMVYLMLYYMEAQALELVGYLRNQYHQRLQWRFAQNTCAIWNLKLLNQIGGMNPECNGDGKTTVSTLEYGEVPLAGMEDIEAYFRASKQQGEFIRWGGVGVLKPATWSFALKRPGTKEYKDNLEKIARQGLVMDVYARRIFSNLEPIEVYDKMMRAASFT
ncbi:MAG: hypothetical protein RI935_9 [Candidatus Parcubacteria bacterium]|jgi:hypothetical protein